MKLRNVLFTFLTAVILTGCGEQQANNQPAPETQATSEKKPLAERMDEAYNKGAIEAFRTSFQQSSVESCINGAVQSGVSRAEATSVCECSLKKVADSLSDDDILVVVKNNGVTAEIEAKIEKAMDNVEECRK